MSFRIYRNDFGSENLLHRNEQPFKAPDHLYLVNCNAIVDRDGQDRSEIALGEYLSDVNV